MGCYNENTMGRENLKMIGLCGHLSSNLQGKVG